MSESSHFQLRDTLLLLLVLIVAGGVRAGYLFTCADAGQAAGPLRVVDNPRPLPEAAHQITLRSTEQPNELDSLIHNLKERNYYATIAPLAADEEQTAHTSPGYPWLIAVLSRVVPEASLHAAVRWLHALLGTLAAGLYFLLARRAFQSLVVALLAGLLTALHPFWIIDTATLNDGTLTTFLLALVLFLGVTLSHQGGSITSLLYGLLLAALCLVRATMLPFAILALVWLLLRSRSLDRGWLYALLAFLGFANGLAPWTVRNIHAFGEPLPVVDSAYLHLWAGNNPHANGGPLTDSMLATLPRAELERIPQHQRYNKLAPLVGEEVRQNPTLTLHRRIQAGLSFLFGSSWLHNHQLAEPVPGTSMPSWLQRSYPVILPATLLGMFLLTVLGWRWTYAWKHAIAPATIAVLWVPLPYLLSHAEALSGPRLPLDGIFLTYAAFVLATLLPGGRRLLKGPQYSSRAPQEPQPHYQPLGRW